VYKGKRILVKDFAKKLNFCDISLPGIVTEARLQGFVPGQSVEKIEEKASSGQIFRNMMKGRKSPSTEDPTITGVFYA